MSLWKKLYNRMYGKTELLPESFQILKESGRLWVDLFLKEQVFFEKATNSFLSRAGLSDFQEHLWWILTDPQRTHWPFFFTDSQTELLEAWVSLAVRWKRESFFPTYRGLNSEIPPAEKASQIDVFFVNLVRVLAKKTKQILSKFTQDMSSTSYPSAYQSSLPKDFGSPPLQSPLLFFCSSLLVALLDQGRNWYPTKNRDEWIYKMVRAINSLHRIDILKAQCP